MLEWNRWRGALPVIAMAIVGMPPGAAVDHLRRHVGERCNESGIRERADVREVYEHARVEGRRSGLVEQRWANRFTTPVANVPAGETTVVELAGSAWLSGGRGPSGVHRHAPIRGRA